MDILQFNALVLLIAARVAEYAQEHSYCTLTFDKCIEWAKLSARYHFDVMEALDKHYARVCGWPEVEPAITFYGYYRTVFNKVELTAMAKACYRLPVYDRFANDCWFCGGKTELVRDPKSGYYYHQDCYEHFQYEES